MKLLKTTLSPQSKRMVSFIFDAEDIPPEAYEILYYDRQDELVRGQSFTYVAIYYDETDSLWSAFALNNGSIEDYVNTIIEQHRTIAY